jgi:hypothetical protein
MRSFAILVFAMAVNASAAMSPAVINRPVVNLFSRATAEANVVSQAIFGTNVEILEDQEDWLRIRTPDQYNGWIEASRAKKRDVYAVNASVATVSNLFGSVYRESSIVKHQPLFILPFEARLEVVEQPEANGQRWIKVRLPDTQEAWIQRGDVTIDGAPITREEMVAFSKRFSGCHIFGVGLRHSATIVLGSRRCCTGKPECRCLETPSRRPSGRESARLVERSWNQATCSISDLRIRRLRTPAYISGTTNSSMRQHTTIQ